MSTHVFNRLAILVLLYSSVLAWNMLYLEPIGVGLGIYGGLSHVTLLSQAFDTFILACASIILLLGSGVIPVLGQHGSWFEPIAKGRVAEYPLIILFTTLGMSSLVSSSDLVTLFLSIELQSLALYILATIYRDSEAATSAGLKYFIVGALSSSLILLGSCLLYGLTGVSSFEGVYLLCSMAVANSGIHLALVIIGIALLFKVAAAPFHNWAPDVYDGVPTIVTTWLAIMPKVAILAFLVSALLSLVIGGLLGLAQYRIKRLLAYSTISHMGFILLALAIHTQEGIEAYLFYLVQYVLTSINIFFVLLAFAAQKLTDQVKVACISLYAGNSLEPLVRAPINGAGTIRGIGQSAGNQTLHSQRRYYQTPSAKPYLTPELRELWQGAKNASYPLHLYALFEPTAVLLLGKHSGSTSNRETIRLH
ncbi:29_t:CDS:2 [Funneliformis geosporum]|nr:29_t:CDS:2 [Funneliformis geosporum]